VASTGVAPGQRLGSLIGGIFGLIYVEANASSLPGPWAAVLEIAAAVAAAGLAVLLVLARGPRPAPGTAAGAAFRGSYWLVVAGEAAAILAGAAILNGPAGLSRAVVAWVSVVVGVHFIVLAVMWRFPLFRYVGAGITLCGVAGLTAAADGAATAVVAGTGGVLPGFVLLTVCCWGAADAAISGTGMAGRQPAPAAILGGLLRRRR
jgi:hypothetical protein